MKLSKRIRLISKNITEKDIYFFRKDLNSFKDLISKMRKANPKASISDCIEGYNKALEELIVNTNTTRSGVIYRYIALESLLGSREYNSIVSRLNMELDFNDKSFEFTGNLEHDYKILINTFFYNEYGQQYEDLMDYSKIYPNDKSIQSKIREIEEQINKLKSGKLSPYELNRTQKVEKEFFEKLRKKEKANIITELSNNILLKISFLRKIGALKHYESDYNHTLEKLSMPSSFRIKDNKSFEEDLLDMNKLQGYSISELIALNAFWTNRLVKEVERRNEVIYVLENTNNFYAFSEGKEFELKDEDIMYYLAEYRALVPYITNFKLSIRYSDKGRRIDKSSNLYRIEYDIAQIFSKEDINYYGFRDLDNMFYNVLLLNNRSQLLYDQKDISIEEMLSFMINAKGYHNAGISIDGDDKKYKDKQLITVDLKGFNAPLMLHIDKDTLANSVKTVSGKTIIPIYRGGKDFIIESSQNGIDTAKTNVLFKLNSMQRKDIAARAGVVGARDTNGRYVTHISWMLNPKKDMPKLISEPKRVFDLETGKIEEIVESEERKK